METWIKTWVKSWGSEKRRGKETSLVSSLSSHLLLFFFILHQVLEWVDHLHEHFVYPASIHSTGRYRMPSSSTEGYSIEMHRSSVQEYAWVEMDWSSISRCERRESLATEYKVGRSSLRGFLSQVADADISSVLSAGIPMALTGRLEKPPSPLLTPNKTLLTFLALLHFLISFFFFHSN